MKIRKILFGMTAGMMAVSSAIVCQVSAGAVDTTLYSNTAVKSWNNLEVDLSKAGIAGDSSSLEISCTAPEDAVDGHRLFNVIINGDWDNPKYTMSYDSSKTDFSVTIPGSELKGKSRITIQACDVDVKLTVKAVDFEEDKRSTADLELDLPINIIMTASTDEYTIGTKADYYVDVTDQFSAKTMGELLQTLKGVNLPAGKYFSDSLGVGADGFEMNIGIHGVDGSGNDYWGCSNNTVSYADGGFISLDSGDIFYPGTSGDTIAGIDVNIRPKMEYVEAQGKSQAVSEKVRNLKSGDTITIQTAEDTRSEITIPAPKGSMVMYCFQDDQAYEGTIACADIPASSVSGITAGKTTVKELKEKYKTISASGKPVYTKDSLNLGKDAFTYAVWMHMKNGSQEEWWGGTLVSFDETAVLYTEDIDNSLDNYTIEEIGFTVYPVLEELPNGKSRAVNEKIRNLDPNKTEKIYINGTEAADDDDDDIKYDGLGEVKAEGNVTFKAAEWDSTQTDCNIFAIDPSWIKTEDDIVIVKMKYNKAYYNEWVRLVVCNNGGDCYVQFDERDFNIHFRAKTLMEKWGCKTVKELTDLNLSVQLWNPELGDNVDYQVSVISPKFEETIVPPESKPADYVPPTIENPQQNKTNAQTTGVKPSKDDPSKKVYDTRFVMSVSERAVISSGKKMVAYISIKRLDTNQVATITTTICYDNVSALGETISAGDGEKLLAFAVVNIPEGVSIEYTSIILSEAE